MLPLEAGVAEATDEATEAAACAGGAVSGIEATWATMPKSRSTMLTDTPRLWAMVDTLTP